MRSLMVRAVKVMIEALQLVFPLMMMMMMVVMMMMMMMMGLVGPSSPLLHCLPPYLPCRCSSTTVIVDPSRKG